MDSKKSVTYYDVLGVRRDASQDTIRAAYRTMAKKLHPDMGGSAASMNTLTRAYNVLSSPEKRKAYDATLRSEQPKTAPPKEEQTTHRKAAQPSAEDLLEQERALVREAKKGAAKSIWIGLGLVILGIVITAATYGAASDGGTYFFAWGPMLFGAIYFIGGLFNYLSPYTALRKSFNSTGYKHKFYLEKAGQPVKAVFIIIGVLIGAVLLMSAIGSGSSSGDPTDYSTGTPNSESAGYKTRYDACLAEFNAIDANLTSVNNRMDQYDAAGYTTLYNNLVDEQNQLVADYNTKYDECEAYRTQYNDSLKN